MQEKNISTFDFEQCMKCSICDSACPMKASNPLYPGPKQAGPDGERYRLKSPEFFDYALKYCLNCKRCEVACPSGVKVADLIAAAKLKYGKSTRPIRDFSLASTDLVGSIASPFAPIVNPLLASKPVSGVMDALMGVDKRRTFPKYSRCKFEDWFRKEAPSQEGFTRRVSYFHGCYVNYNFPQLGKDFVELMNACGYGVRLLDGEKCCGVALLAGGFKEKAGRNAKANLECARRAVASGSEAVLATSSSCIFTMRDEYPNLLGIANEDILDSLKLATGFLFDKVESGEVRLAFKEGLKMHYAYHTACHMQRLGWYPYSIGLLKMVPGLELDILPQECCGIAGTFGFKKENYDYSQAIGSKLFASIRESGASAVVTDCETCKWQIEMSAGVPVVNPISLLVECLDIRKTKELNNGQ